MHWPRISIVTPSFNQGRFIEDTIRSVMLQDYPDIEYIIIDGGSTDNTVEIIKKYQDYISFWISEPDKGQTDAINKGLQKTTGDIVAWINSDDRYYSGNVFKEIAFYFASAQNVDACYGDNVYIDENNRLLYLRKGVPFFSKRLFFAWDYIHQPTVFMRRRVVEDLALNDDLQYVMDYEYFMRISRKYNIRYSNILVSASRWHRSSKTIVNTTNVFRELQKVRTCLKPGFPGRLIPPQYLYKLLFNLNRIMSLPFLLRLGIKKQDVPAQEVPWGGLLRRQLFGIRRGEVREYADNASEDRSATTPKSVESKYMDGEYLRYNPTWDSEHAPRKARELIEVIPDGYLKKIFDRAPLRVVEIGCGAGGVLCRFSDYLKERGIDADPVGYDISPAAVEMARKQYGDKVNYVCGEGLVPGEEASLILLVDVIEHVFSPEDFIRSQKEHARFFLIRMPLEKNVWNIVTRKLSKLGKEQGHIHFYTYRTAMKFVRDQGLEIIADGFTNNFSDRANRKTIVSRLMHPIRHGTSLVSRKLNSVLWGGNSLALLVRRSDAAERKS